LKTKFRNPSTFRSTEQNKSFIQTPTESIIFSGDNFGEKMNARQSQAQQNLVSHERHQLTAQIWYD